MREMTQALANQGRYGDSVMVHMNPAEVEGMGILSGQPLTVNPTTGAYEAFNWGQTLGGIAGGAIAGPWGAGIGAGLGSKFIDGASTGDALTAGLTSGIMSWGVGSFAASDMGQNLLPDFMTGGGLSGSIPAGAPAFGGNATLGPVSNAVASGQAGAAGGSGGMFGGMFNGMNVPAAVGAGAAGLFSTAGQVASNPLPTGAYGGNSYAEYQNEQFPNERTALTSADRSTPAYLAKRAQGIEQSQFKGPEAGFGNINTPRRTAAQGGIVQGYADGGQIRRFADGNNDGFDDETGLATSGFSSFAPDPNTAQQVGQGIQGIAGLLSPGKSALTFASQQAGLNPEGIAQTQGRNALFGAIPLGPTGPFGSVVGALGKAVSGYGDYVASEDARGLNNMTQAAVDMEGFDAGRGLQADPNDPNFGFFNNLGMGIVSALGGDNAHQAMTDADLAAAQQNAVFAHNQEVEPSDLEVASFNLANPTAGNDVGNQADQDAYGEVSAQVGSTPDGTFQDVAEDTGPYGTFDGNGALVGPQGSVNNSGAGLFGGKFGSTSGMSIDTENWSGNPNISMSPAAAASSMATNDQVEPGAGQGVAGVTSMGNLAPVGLNLGQGALGADYGVAYGADEDENDPNIGLGTGMGAFSQADAIAALDDEDAAVAAAAAAAAETAAAADAAAAANAAAAAITAGMGDPSTDGTGGNDGSTGGIGAGDDMSMDDFGEDEMGDGGVYAQGGLVRGHANNPQGATVDQGQDPILMGAVAAIQGQHPEPQKAVQAFIQVYGPKKFAALRERVIADAGQEQAQASGLEALKQQLAPAMPPSGPAVIPQAPPAQPEQQMAQMIDPRQNYAVGGQVRGFYRGKPTKQVSGPGDGLSDSVPANIEGREPVNLAAGEVIVPADVVSDAGNGDSDAGADFFAELNENIRMKRHGTNEQPAAINPAALVPTMPGMTG